MGEVHARALRAAGGTLAAVAAGSPERAAEGARRLGAEWAADSVEALLVSPEVDIVHICTPNYLHAPLAHQAIAAGKHVVCEKPLATSRADAEELVSAANFAGVVATVPFVYRYYPMVREAQARVASGASGPLRLIHGSYLQDWLSRPDDHNWRVDRRLGGASRAFADIGVHWCDLVEFSTGHRITALTARLVTAVSRQTNAKSGSKGTEAGTEDIASILFETDQGALGSLVASQVSPGRKNRLWFSLDGALTSLAFDQEQPESLWVGSRETTALMLRGASGMSADAQRFSVLPAGHPQGYQECFNAFISDTYSAVLGGTPHGLPRFTDGLRAAVLTEAVLVSAASRSWTEVPA